MIPFAEPDLTGKEREYVAEAVASGWVSGGGPFVERFEEMVARASGRRHCIATITGSAALHTVISVFEFRESIQYPTYTFVAMRNLIASMGIYPDSGGGPFTTYDYGRVSCESSPLFLADCAPSIGYIDDIHKDVKAAAYTLSFNGNKTVTTGQGGAILCDDDGLAEKFRTAIRQTSQENWDGRFNYRMPNLNAAIGCAQMERLEEFLEKKRRIWDRYLESALGVTAGGRSHWMTLYGLMADLKSNTTFETKKLWNTDYWCLPCSGTLTKADQDKVIKACAEFSR